MRPVTHTSEPQIAKLTALGQQLAIDRGFAVWLANGAAILAIFLLSSRFSFLDAYPAAYTLPVAGWTSSVTDWFLDNFKPTARFISSVLAEPIASLRALLQWLPWPAVVVAVGAISYAAAGWRLALFAVCSMMYMAVTGFWQQSMYTLAVVIVAVPISLILGFLVGVLAFRSQSFRNIVNPTLDVMQTMPAFSYLVPILVLFGLGPVVGVVATAIYAIPPIVRNTILGLDRVSEEIVESGRMSGSSRFQLLWWIRIPVSVPTLLVGVNQTIMAGLSMVVITAILGGFPDIGLEVINSMKKARFGESILAGFVIVLMAMLLDRISGGFVARQINPRLRRHNPELRRRVLHGFGLTFLAILAAYLLWPSIGLYPETLVFFPAEQLNNAIGWFTRNFYDYTQAVKDAAFFFLLLPLKEGMKESVRPHVWGFTLNEFTTSVYVVLVFVGAVTATVLGNWRLGVGVAALGLLYFFGTLGIPWLAIVLLVVVPAWQIGGGNVALLALVGLLFIAITGLWDRAMVSVQLCGAGVLVSFLIGSTLGVIAALSDQFSKIIRPINDTLQTMPIFVFLIPSVMVFLVGEFTALVSIVLYATVPSIRYTEHGIRNVPSNVVEAARMCGASRLQVLRDVQLPMALPEMMLGLNQTIMMGLAMVVVATLVGAKGLGQEIMIALTWADVGRGLVAGLAIAFIAMITDRVFQAWSFRKKQELGFS